MKNKEEEKAFRGIKEIGADIARLASIQEHIDQAELHALEREYLKALHRSWRAQQKRNAGE
jgi:hypothetical protein